MAGSETVGSGIYGFKFLDPSVHANASTRALCQRQEDHRHHWGAVNTTLHGLRLMSPQSGWDHYQYSTQMSLIYFIPGVNPGRRFDRMRLKPKSTFQETAIIPTVFPAVIIP